ncbi:hypothetical protein [Microbacterium sp. CH12i]|uniref:hypothetical protein n=1 Tax=Microbacterium sp. CH12i TaxID=1479651 RepID=UPI0013630253|nr:hypothetical protein [Microbacterium sp. CH12i]
MMHAMRRVAMVGLRAFATIGVAGGRVWGLAAFGFINSLVVISGLTKPEITTGYQT